MIENNTHTCEITFSGKITDDRDWHFRRRTCWNGWKCMSRYRHKSLKKSFLTERQNKKKKADFAINNAIKLVIFNLHALALDLVLAHALALFLSPDPDLSLLCAADQFPPRPDFVFLVLLI